MSWKEKTFTVDESDLGHGCSTEDASVESGSQGKPKRKRSRVVLAKQLLSLIPSQFRDEVTLAKKEFRRRGIILATSAAFFGVALVAALFLSIAAIVAIIAGIATIMPLWLAAILTSIVFFAVIIVFTLLGIWKMKKALPVVPERALRGIVLDRGVLKDGSKFDPSGYDRRQERKHADKQRAKEATKEQCGEQKKRFRRTGNPGPEPSLEEINVRLTARREQMSSLRDQLFIKPRLQKKSKKIKHPSQPAQSSYNPETDECLCEGLVDANEAPQQDREKQRSRNSIDSGMDRKRRYDTGAVERAGIILIVSGLFSTAVFFLTRGKKNPSKNIGRSKRR